MASGETEASSEELIRTIIDRPILSGLVSMGLARGALAGNGDAAIWYKEVQENLQAAYEKDRNIDPPKPPSRPNARVGGLALGHGF